MSSFFHGAKLVIQVLLHGPGSHYGSFRPYTVESSLGSMSFVGSRAWPASQLVRPLVCYVMRGTVVAHSVVNLYVKSYSRLGHVLFA